VRSGFVHHAATLDETDRNSQGWHVLNWLEFADERPDLAAAGQDLLYQFGVGLGFLATLRNDGRPRLHPMCPILSEAGIFAFIIPSPKQRDLRRDGLYAMHSFPCPDNEDAFYITGRAELVEDAPLRQDLARQFVDEREQFQVPTPPEDDLLFSFLVDSCLVTRTKGHGDTAPQHSLWHYGGG
jgi:hypothetical protein